MWKNLRNSKLYVAVLGVFVLTVVFAQVGKAGYFEPGTKEDPIVTQTYVEKRNEQLRYYIDQKIEELNSKLNQTQANQFFQVIEVQKGQKVICRASTELIVRSGQAKAIASSAGGLSNLISGKDLKSGEIVPMNQLILVPRDDGRGLDVTADKTFILIKGGYDIK
ncbi:hypothetical protein SAMN02745975_00410 [Geosporobacter subterraneus DSM 17957]|uniref:Uncharacterized protein n=1 Tax=Geosporobacter subterraneus DSM 17957 TaxID=1121919 RepID=A0A1M6D7Y8_9FIRM|nr:hypothetical protein [Geosporobacter subterraneus]SHI69342.1 hypothetical protein SAMN02745975_00410 [Geosporobacter subterraneus DSM 17957]